MKKWLNFAQYFFGGVALIIALLYAFGFSYLLKGMALTYLRGEKSSTIDDGKFFKSAEILAGKKIEWKEDPLYNKKPLPSALRQNLEKTNTAAFLVIKNGKILQEEYWDGYDKTTPTNSFSMAKAVTVMLASLAIVDGKIESFDEPFSDFYNDFSKDPFGKRLTLRQLATMEAGLDWEENYQNPFLPNAKAYYGNSLSDAVFKQKFKEEPGTKFEYQSGATQLLGFAVRKAVNEPLADYLSQKIWIPLGMQEKANWTIDEYGMEKSFCCIHSNARDFAKLGFLLLNDGNFNGRQILLPAFVEEMRTPTELSKGAYGMGLWINNDAKNPHYYFRGLYGQYIIVVPKYQLVIVRTGMNKNLETDAKGRPTQVEFIVNQTVQNL